MTITALLFSAGVYTAFVALSYVLVGYIIDSISDFPHYFETSAIIHGLRYQTGKLILGILASITIQLFATGGIVYFTKNISTLMTWT